jgi:predicted RNase H-like nuclease (RuvC/YqgF family)
MGDHEKKSESENKSECDGVHLSLWRAIERLQRSVKELEGEVIRMQRSYDALGRRLEGSERHVEDEGWFD